jgi:hypothetical protein
MPTKIAAPREMDASDSTRLVAVRDRRTGQLRILSAAHVVSGGPIEDAAENLDLAFLAALGRGGRS